MPIGGKGPTICTQACQVKQYPILPMCIIRPVYNIKSSVSRFSPFGQKGPERSGAKRESRRIGCFTSQRCPVRTLAAYAHQMTMRDRVNDVVFAKQSLLGAITSA